VKRVLVVFEPGRGGAAALNFARQVADHENATVTVVGLAPQAMSGSRCGNSALDYNAAVEDAVTKDIEQVCERLREAGTDASCQLLVEDDRQLEEFTSAGAFDLVLLPARRRPLRAASHPAAAWLTHVAGTEIRVVDPRAPQ
jgi:hypothetical protein